MNKKARILNKVNQPILKNKCINLILNKNLYNFTDCFKLCPKKKVLENNVDEDIANISKFAYILFFLPLIKYKNNMFARFHANQSLVLLLSFLLCAGCCVGLFFLSVPVGIIISPIVLLIFLLFMIDGAVGAKNQQNNSVLFFGKIKLIKF